MLSVHALGKKVLGWLLEVDVLVMCSNPDSHNNGGGLTVGPRSNWFPTYGLGFPWTWARAC